MCNFGVVFGKKCRFKYSLSVSSLKNPTIPFKMRNMMRGNR